MHCMAFRILSMVNMGDGRFWEKFRFSFASSSYENAGLWISLETVSYTYYSMVQKIGAPKTKNNLK